MDLRKPAHATSTQSRIASAVAAQLRQDFDPSLKNMQEYAEALLAEFDKQQPPDIIGNLHLILEAVENLRKRIAAATGGEDAAQPHEAGRKLRHDLNNLLGGIKGAGECLIEDFEDQNLNEAVATLQALVQETERLRGALDRVVRYTEEPTVAAPEADLAKAVIASIAPAENAVSTVEAGDYTLLVVDDNPLNQSVLRQKLERQGYRVETAGSGGAALERLDKIGSDEQPGIDLILLDLLMPDMNGYEVLQRLRREQRWRDIPVIIISAWDDLQSIARCIESGAEDYLIKPFEPVILRARIGSALEKRRLRQREQELLQREIDQAIQIQRSLMSPPAPSGSPIDGRNRPVRYVSGDFFEHFRRPNGVIPFALGDVAGKGFDAALLMAKVAGLFRYLSKTWDDCGELLATLNQECYDRATRGRFITAVVGFYDPAQGRIRFANAGHTPPVLITPDGHARTYPANAPPLGVLPRARYRVDELTLGPGSAFYVFSDGFIECRRPNGEELDLDGLIPLLQRVQGMPLQQRLDQLFADVTAPGWQARDDLTMLAMIPIV